MIKTIWACWFQGREAAPPLVKKCLRSWERNNPGWEFRCLDATSIERYVPLRQYVDLDRQRMTAATLSNFVRILLLREFGGVWVDATLFCNRPLDEWLPGVMEEGFFAFAAPGPDRPLSSWFLSAEPNNYLISTWLRWMSEYWSNQSDSDDYFWFHHRFRDMYETDPSAAEAWSRVAKVSADGPHALQFGGHMYRPAPEALGDIDWTTPVFKLTHRLTEGLKAGSLVEHLLERDGDEHDQNERPPAVTLSGEAPRSFAAPKVSTENLGDHIQIISGLRLLSRLGVEPTRSIDRDNEIHSAPGLDKEEGPIGILLNGWFKTNRGEWPPLSLTLSRRIDNAATQTEVFVVSRDERIKDYLPRSIGPYTFVSHYSGSNNFAANMARAEELLVAYRSRAKLIVTTLLHCALPAIAMGIPVVVFYPINDDSAHASYRDRFSSLEGLVPVHRFDEIESVNWHPEPVDVSEIKLRILDRFYEMAARWQIAPSPPIGPIAPSSVLPPP